MQIECAEPRTLRPVAGFKNQDHIQDTCVAVVVRFPTMYFRPNRVGYYNRKGVFPVSKTGSEYALMCYNLIHCTRR